MSTGSEVDDHHRHKQNLGRYRKGTPACNTGKCCSATIACPAGSAQTAPVARVHLLFATSGLRVGRQGQPTLLRLLKPHQLRIERWLPLGWLLWTGHHQAAADLLSMLPPPVHYEIWEYCTSRVQAQVLQNLRVLRKRRPPLILFAQRAHGQ